MADENKPKIIIVAPKRVETSSQPSAVLPKAMSKSMPIRSEDELSALAMQLAENKVLMQRFRAAFGSKDERLTGRVMNEVREYAQSLDPSVNFREGTRLALLLVKTLGLVKDDSNGR
jgi:hypothetical protein